MNDKQVNEYMQNLIKVNGKGLKGLEFTAWAQFSELNKKLKEATEQLRVAEQQVEQARNFTTKTAGQIEAFVTLLVMAESSRRDTLAKGAEELAATLKVGDASPEEVPPIEMGEFAKSLGANKVEALDLGGNVLASTEDTEGEVKHGDSEARQ